MLTVVLSEWYNYGWFFTSLYFSESFTSTQAFEIRKKIWSKNVLKSLISHATHSPYHSPPCKPPPLESGPILSAFLERHHLCPALGPLPFGSGLRPREARSFPSLPRSTFRPFWTCPPQPTLGTQCPSPLQSTLNSPRGSCLFPHWAWSSQKVKGMGRAMACLYASVQSWAWHQEFTPYCKKQIATL